MMITTEDNIISGQMLMLQCGVKIYLDRFVRLHPTLI